MVFTGVVFVLIILVDSILCFSTTYLPNLIQQHTEYESSQEQQRMLKRTTYSANRIRILVSQNMIWKDPTSTTDVWIQNTFPSTKLKTGTVRRITNLRLLSAQTASTNFEVSNEDDEDFDVKAYHRQMFLNKYGSKNKNTIVRKVTRQKYNRQRIPESEKQVKYIRELRQAEYDRMVNNTNGILSIWTFESLFPKPVWDNESIQRDLYGVKERDSKQKASRLQLIKKGGSDGSVDTADTTITADSSKMNKKRTSSSQTFEQFHHSKIRSSWYGGNSMMRIWREPRQSSGLPSLSMTRLEDNIGQLLSPSKDEVIQPPPDLVADSLTAIPEMMTTSIPETLLLKDDAINNKNSSLRNATLKIDRDLTRMVEDRVYGYRRLQTGEFRYETSLMGDGAVTFRDGVRLGNPLRINSDRLNYLAKKEMQKGRIEEASELYERAVTIDPRDGRAYLGLSRCAERRRDFKLARKWLQLGVTNSVSLVGDQPDRGANPFLLQAMGCLEEKMGNLAAAESLYILAVKSRPTHAAAWVSLAQIRTRKLGQPSSAGRVCFQTAERELMSAGLSPSAYVYTAWASLEYKDGDTRAARKLYKKAIDVDSKCSAAWLQLGVLEANTDNWDEAEKCFSTVLKYDQRNSRVIQAYALAEAKKPECNSRNAIELFERALKVNPRDAGVLQAYALYVAELGDIKSAQSLLRRGTEVNKRHPAVWQAWGVLETRLGNFDNARKVFQEGIWACGQLTGSQSGGYDCARLWQAWGVLEARCKDYAAARRCFSRALDADKRNVPAVTAWALMEEELGNRKDARMIIERSLRNFAAGSSDKIGLWRTYELMEQRCGDKEAATAVYQRSMRETMTIQDEDDYPVKNSPGGSIQQDPIPELNDVLNNINRKTKSNNEFEVIRWESTGGEIWMNEKAIETKINIKKQLNKKKR